MSNVLFRVKKPDTAIIEKFEKDKDIRALIDLIFSDKEVKKSLDEFVETIVTHVKLLAEAKVLSKEDLEIAGSKEIWVLGFKQTLYTAWAKGAVRLLVKDETLSWNVKKALIKLLKTEVTPEAVIVALNSFNEDTMLVLMNVLLAKTENVLEQVKERQKALSEHADGDGGKQEGIQITEIDREFLDKAIALIEGSLSDDGFGVDELAREIGMSRSVLYRKIRALTGMSIVEFLRHIRLDNAERLLKSGKYNVSEVMYMVGFSSLSYFSRAFKKEFGRLPTETSDRKPQK